ncbi:MAG: prephenate dehydrogenase/arogenate dehydrogenase family protein, partial [Anaerolineales bacterium]|nr:prephenate dehydrogenase/arogenate dehydrogenase family protein [Anaerolineales bacterium]
MLEVDPRGDNDFFKDLQVAVVGLGLMGGSLAMGLGGHCKQILAVDPDVRTREIAIRAGIVNQVSADPAEILPLADLVILAAPVSAILEIIPALPSLHPGSLIVIDLGSTKAKICQALGKLPGRFEVVGGHPMCGKAAGGLEHAEAGLFQDSPFAFTPLPNSTERALQCAQQLADILGAKPVWTGPNTHDSWVAATSHLPYLLSSALSLATPPEAAQLVGPGFRSTSRLAGSPSTIMLPILETNREQVL